MPSTIRKGSARVVGWNVIVREKVLEDNNYNLRRVNTPSGTGPFVSRKARRE
jgi:hypothetical protein